MTGPPDRQSELAQAEARLAELDAERGRVQACIDGLRARASAPLKPDISVSAPPDASTVLVPVTQAEKVALFGALFRGRTDVYPRRWENAHSAKAGYAPHCANEWKRGVCEKPKVKCGECPAMAFVPVTDRVLYNHLQGSIVAGVYPIIEGDRCHFIAVDFDGDGWQADVTTFAETARAVGLPVAVERSRSGSGAHAWFFFDDPTAAVVARRSASFSSPRRCPVESNWNDVLRPAVPKPGHACPRGGFGNLIALPLQWSARRRATRSSSMARSVPWPDQWGFLARRARIPVEAVCTLAERPSVAADPRRSLGDTADEDDRRPWTRARRAGRSWTRIHRPAADYGEAVLAPTPFHRDGGALRPPCSPSLRRLAAFQNPEFYKKQAMRFSTGGPEA